MSFTFLHTADWQLGKPFASMRDEAKRNRLQHERIHAIERIAALAASNGVKAVLVAGDVFDSPKATRATVSAACAAIGAMGVPVLVIPGNHDHGGPGSIWEQAFFLREQQQLAPNLQVLLKPEPVVLKEAVIFPAPLMRRHETSDPTAWIRAAMEAAADSSGLPRIVLAHGTVQGFGSAHDDEEDMAPAANWVDLSRLPMDELDYLALGDWHGTKQIGPKAWYAGTPEQDRFPRGDVYEAGQVLKVTVERGREPQVEKLPTGKLAWRELDFVFSEDTGLELLAARLEETTGTRAADQVVRLTLSGSLGIEAASRLEQMLESWDSRLLRLKLENQVTLAPSAEEITALTQRADDPLVSAVASQLAAQLQADDEEAAVARVALRELHAACLAAQ